MTHSSSASRERLRWPCSARHALPALLFLATLTAQAQNAPSAGKPDPLDPKASVPALSYESSFARYRRLSDEKLISWRDANDTVTRIGGWRVYAREAQQPDPAPGTAPPAKPAGPAPTPDSKPSSAPAPMPAGHGGHKTP